MRKTFKYRLKINKTIEDKFQNTLNLCRNLYNHCLEERINAYKRDKRSIFCYEQQKQLITFKKLNPEYKEIFSQILYDAIQRLDKAYRNFFRRVKNGGGKLGFPRFKGYNRYDSFTYPQHGWKLKGNKLILSKIGNIKIILHRPIQGNIKTVTIKKNASSKWFVCFSCNNVPMKPLEKTGKKIAIDVGCKNFTTDNNGKKIENPKFLNKSQDILNQRKSQRDKMKKGTQKRKKLSKLIAKIYEKIANQRKDFHHKIAYMLIKKYDIIFIERMKSWNSFRYLNKSMRDAAWFQFFNILHSKAEEAEKTIVEVPAENTSQICSRCGGMVEKDLSVRIHNCPYCGLSIDRDHNAALNIYRLGASLLQPFHDVRREASLLGVK